MNVALDNTPSNFVSMIICDSQRKRRQSNKRKEYMRNIIYAEYDIEREGEEDKDDRNRYYGDPWGR